MFRGDFTPNRNNTEANNNTLLRHNNIDGEIRLNNRRFKQVLMVFSGKKRGNGERDSAEEEDMERLKPLHNFDLPYLRWGNQKLLRCMKVDSNGEVSMADRNQSSESGTGGYLIGTRRRNSNFEIRFRSSDDDHDHRKLSSPEKVTARIRVAGDGEIEATREKLMFDFQTEVGKMKDAILGKSMTGPPPATAATPLKDSPAERPWNLRTRRAACKVPRSPTKGAGEVLKPNSSPVTNEFKYPKLRPKFSVSLSRQEIEEDFMAMAGRRLQRKPKKRPRVVQKQLDTLFPGLWLTEITADLYKVPDEAEIAKR